MGLMLAALLMSLALLVLAALGIHLEDDARLILERINFRRRSCTACWDFFCSQAH